MPIISGCESSAAREEREREEEHMENVRRRIAFADRMRFSAHADRMPGFRVRFNQRRNNHPYLEDYVDIAFVHSPEEAERFPDNVFVVWPSVTYDTVHGNREVTLWGTENQLGHFIVGVIVNYSDVDVDFRDFGLPENEITLYDLVERWGDSR